MSEGQLVQLKEIFAYLDAAKEMGIAPELRSWEWDLVVCAARERLHQTEETKT